MKKRLFALLACALALCVALVGCGGAKPEGAAAESPAPAADATQFVGTWEIASTGSGEEVMTTEDLKILKDLGIYIYLDVFEDGTLALDAFGEVLDGTWEATGEGVATGTLDEAEIEIALAGDTLTIVQDDASMSFSRIDPADRLDNEAGLAALQEQLDGLGIDLDIDAMTNP